LYEWRVNDVATGSNSSVFSSTALNNNDLVQCIVTSNAACATSLTATSATTTIIVNQVPTVPTITLSSGGTTLTSSSATGNQWYLNGVQIIGAQSQVYVATQNGNYTVTATNGTCSSVASATTTVGSVSVAEVTNLGTHFTIYPNPSTGKFTLVFTSTEIMKYKVELRNVLGQVVFTEEINDFAGLYTKDFDITEYSKGEYFLVITDSKKHKMEKLIVY
jgi:hypothetical protein